MARQPDRPGQYRIKRKTDGQWWLGGLQLSGNRVRASFATEVDARDAATKLFGSVSPPPPVSKPAPQSSASFDDWGLPTFSVDPHVAASINETLGVKPEPPPLPVIEAPVPPVDEKKKQEDRERAKSLCEFFGVCWAAGDVWIGKRGCEYLGKVPPNPSVGQVNNLAKAAKTAFVDLLGDLEVGPWTMLMLLSIALPASMMIQARSLPKKVQASEPGSSDAHLKSV